MQDLPLNITNVKLVFTLLDGSACVYLLCPLLLQKLESKNGFYLKRGQQNQQINE